jgi:hypothetical protein
MCKFHRHNYLDWKPGNGASGVFIAMKLSTYLMKLSFSFRHISKFNVIIKLFMKLPLRLT